MARALLLFEQASRSLLPSASDSRLKRTRTAALPSPGYRSQLTKFNSTLHVATSWIGLQIRAPTGGPAKASYPRTPANSSSPPMRVATPHTMLFPTVAFPVLSPLHEENCPNPSGFASGPPIMSMPSRTPGGLSTKRAPLVPFR